MKVQVKLAGERAQDLQQDESPGKAGLAGGCAQDLQQDESSGKAGRRACPGSTTG